MKNAYLAATIAGAVIPWYFFLQYFTAEGLSFAGFIAAAVANPAAAGVTADAVFASFVFWLFMFHRSRFAHGPAPWLFIALNLLIGLCCALPAYFYAQERQRTVPAPA
jgi:hypothetical protein